MKNRFALYFRILSYLSTYKRLLFFSILLSLLYSVSNIYAMPLVRDIADQLANKRLDHFTNHVVNAFLLFSIRLFSQYAQIYVVQNIANRLLLTLRVEIFEKLHRLPQSFFSKSKSGDLITRLFSDVAKVQEMVVMTFERFFPKILSFFGVVGYLIYLDWKLTALSLIGIPAFLKIVVYFSTKLKRITGQIQRKTADLTQMVQESVQNMKMVQSFNMQARNVDRFHDVHFRNLRSTMREVRYKCTQEPLVALLQFVLMLMIVWYGGYLVVEGSMTGPELTSYFTGILILIDIVVSVSRGFTKTHQSMACLERVIDILDMNEDIVQPKSPVVLDKVDGVIQFENVTFGYGQGGAPVLQNISFDVKRGETIALVGLSGAGKSTLINLIPRFYDVSDGCVKIDGVDVREFDLHFLRQSISLVPQDPFLFRGTILQNIRMGKSDASISDVSKISNKVSLQFIDDMPDKFLTKIGDQGRMLSGGQKQRLAIARALLKDAQILLLDEPTSSLDSQSEEEVQAAFATLMKGRTSIVIAHRLSTIMNADRIIVMKDGGIDAIGTHDDLITQNGHYAMLYNLQFKGDGSDPSPE